jgi:hypothetical protein
VISATELALLLSGADGDQQLDAIASLFDRGLVAAVIDGDAITAIRTTSAGDSALRVMTLPESKE